MAKPRIFLSSTCYDLGDARAALTTFLEGGGFEVLNSQTGKFGVKPRSHSHDACLAEMEHADFVILIIGGRRGGTYVGSEKSITNEEIKVAQRRELPVLAFVDRQVDAMRALYSKNPGADFKPHVDDVRVFDFINYIASGHEDNWLHPFGSVTDIIETIRSQLAHYLLLYSRSLRTKDKAAAATASDAPRAVGFPANLGKLPVDGEDEATLMRDGLRVVYDTLKAILDSDISEGAKREQLKTIWVIARHGEASDRRLWMKEDRFKATAWGVSKGRRVFNQMEGSGISGDYDIAEDGLGRQYQTIEITFDRKKSRDAVPGSALKTWVETLVSAHDDDGFALFARLDMRMFAGEPAVRKVRPRPKTVIAKTKVAAKHR